MLKVYNTLSRSKEEFKPVDDGKVRFYHCGPTVYWVQHIGNMRAMVLADVIRRSLSYLEYDVKFVRNYTDVGHLTGDNAGDADGGEDRMEKAAKREDLSPEAVADKYIQHFEKDTAALNIVEPDNKPRATLYVDKVINMVQELLNKDFAYTTEKAVYFDVSKAKNYTALSGQDPEKIMHGAGSGDVQDGGKKHPADFALWFFKTGAHKNALQTWPSPFESPAAENGEGFPGWHIECSVMSKDLLGDTLDFHMGGIEHIPIHHTNEIAQSESANGTTFVNYWLHNEHLVVDDKKMAKSEGTSYILNDIIEKGFDPLALRYFFLGAHYRSKQNFTWEALEASQSALRKLRGRVAGIESGGDIDTTYKEKFEAFLSDDFSIPEALALSWDLMKDDSVTDADKKATLLDFDAVLGLKLGDTKETEAPADIQQLVEDREQARKDKDFDASDRLRSQIKQLGYEVRDTDDGPKLTRL